MASNSETLWSELNKLSTFRPPVTVVLATLFLVCYFPEFDSSSEEFWVLQWANL